MICGRRKTLLRHHALTKLRLAHAAWNESYELSAPDNRMMVNRLLFVTKNDSHGTSLVRDKVTGKVFPMRKNNVYFIPCRHLIDLELADDLHFMSLQFNVDVFYGFDAFELHPQCEVLKVPEIISKLRELLEREDDFLSLCQVNEIIYGFCCRFAGAVEDEVQYRLNKSDQYSDILDYIKFNGDAGTSVEELAKKAGMRRDVFSRNFSRDLGISPKHLIVNMLLRKSAELLMTPGMRVREVAEQLHFSSEYYFSSFFKKNTGVSPKSFQERAGE